MGVMCSLSLAVVSAIWETCQEGGGQHADLVLASFRAIALDVGLIVGGLVDPEDPDILAHDGPSMLPLGGSAQPGHKGCSGSFSLANNMDALFPFLAELPAGGLLKARAGHDAATLCHVCQRAICIDPTCAPANSELAVSVYSRYMPE